MEKGTNIHRDNEIEGRTDRRRETRGENRDRQPYRETRARIIDRQIHRDTSENRDRKTQLYTGANRERQTQRNTDVNRCRQRQGLRDAEKHRCEHIQTERKGKTLKHTPNTRCVVQ